MIDRIRYNFYELRDKFEEYKYKKFHSSYDVIVSFLDETDDIEDIETVWKIWEKTFSKIMRRSFGFNKSATKEFFDWSGSGHNWEKLWYDDNKAYIQDYEFFRNDLGYISDRLSMDRILRVHYMLGSAIYKYKISKEVVK